MRPIDAHVHVGRWRLAEFQGRCTTIDEARQVYLKYDWAGALLFPTDEGDSTGLLREAELSVGAPIFRVGYWADFTKAGNLERFVADAHRFAVLKVHPSCLKTPVTDAVWQPYLELAARRSMPIVIHCGRWQDVAGFEKALAVAKRHPDTPVLLAHMGGDSPHLVTSAVDAVAAGRLDNAFLGTESIREPWLLEYAVARLGSSRLVFGSDYNLNHPEPFRRLVEVLDISDTDRTNLLRDNINHLLAEDQRFI